MNLSNISWSHFTSVIKRFSSVGNETSAGKREGKYVLKDRCHSANTACFSDWCSDGKVQVCYYSKIASLLHNVFILKTVMF